MTTYKIKQRRGITDLKSRPNEVWTESEADYYDRMEPIFARYNRMRVAALKRGGCYGEEYEISLKIQHNPVFDEPRLLPGASSPFSSYRMIFIT